MDPHLLLNPKASRQKGINPESPLHDSLSSSPPPLSLAIDFSSSQIQPPDNMDGFNGTDPNTSQYEPYSQLQWSTEAQPGYDSLLGQLASAAGEGNIIAGTSMDHKSASSGSGLTFKGASAPQQQGNTLALPAYDPRALLNPKAPPKRPASDASSDRGGEDMAELGQIALVERLHNVNYRTASPAKRVKTDDGITSRQPTPTITGGSTLNIKPKGGEQPHPSRPASTAIDLTMSDDEDIKVVKDNGKQVICIGRVKQAYVQSHVVPYPDPSKYRGNHASQGRIKVSFRRGGVQRTTNVIMVVDPTGREFGRVDMKTAQGLAPLMDAAKNNGLQWMAFTDMRRKQPNEGPPGSPLSTLIGLTLQLYCPRMVAQDIGRYLKTKNIFLGDPIIELGKHDYFNPQNSNHFSTREVGEAEFQATHNGGSSYASNASYGVRSVEEIREDITSMFDKIVNLDDLPQRDQPHSIKTPLKPHQKRGLHFMVDKEAEWTEEKETRQDSLWKIKMRKTGRKYYSHVITGEEIERKPETPRGGILADEMGMGKTLSILALIADADSQTAANHFASKAPPVSANGTRRHHINSRATLLVCPLSTMVNWKNQIDEHFPPGMGPKWCYYHGTDRNRFTVNELADYDLVITTYHMVAADAMNPKKPLGFVSWFRIVLDEAHQIRSGKSLQAKAVYDLAAQRRWAVTGTPVQNRLEDLFALFKFLRVKPFHETAGFNTHILGPFKAADPDVVPKLQLLVGSLTLRRLKEGNLNLPPRHDDLIRLRFSEDEQRLHDWFERDSARQVNAVTSGEKLGGTAYARILKAILYLRLISAHGRDLLGDEALKLTEGMTSENPMELEEEESRSPALTRKAVYEMLELLRQTDMAKCQFPSCKKDVCDAEDDSDSSDDDDADGGRSKKHNTFGFMTPCYHIICPAHAKKLRNEWSQETEDDKQVECQFCDAHIRPVLFEMKHSDWNEFQEERESLKRDPRLAKKMGAYTGPHTKTKALLEDLQRSKLESMAHPDERPIKSVIFSCWTTHLDLIQIALENNGHTYTRLDGRMDRKSRDRALTAFASDPNISVILVSIGAGGLGLNLTTANKVYVMEPQFNPAAEAQAVDRVHRLGQTREVWIKRYIMEGSFEEKMLELQRKKKALADLTMAREKGSKEKLAKQRLEDLRSLFR